MMGSILRPASIQVYAICIFLRDSLDVMLPLECVAQISGGFSGFQSYLCTAWKDVEGAAKAEWRLQTSWC